MEFVDAKVILSFSASIYSLIISFILYDSFYLTYNVDSFKN